MMSVVIPVYKNADNIPHLLRALDDLCSKLEGRLEAVFVVDGSPDDSYLRLASDLPNVRFKSQLLQLSRNFGSFAAIRAGLEAGRGDRFAVMAADLQEPPELLLEFDRILHAGDHDVVVGQRVTRADPFPAGLLSRLFWALYRRFVQGEIPEGGVDIFGCRQNVRDHIVQLRENNSSLIGLLFWVGFRRATIPYERRKRSVGKSAWTFQKRIRYLSDSLFSFSDLPIRILLQFGLLGLVASFVLGGLVVASKVSGLIEVPGYAATVLLIMFFGGLNSFALGVIGGYVWRTFENTKQRPNYIVASQQVFSGERLGDSPASN